MSGRRWLMVAVQAAAVIGGGLWGRAVHYPGRPPTVYTLLAIVAVLLMAAGTVASLAGRRGEPRHTAAVSGGCLVYTVGVMLSEPFLDVHGLPTIAAAALVLIPLLPAFSFLCRRGAWTTASGVAVFVFTSAAMLAGNAGVSDAASGFFGYSVS